MTSECPLVSIVMPARNAEQFLARAIQSLILQTYPNWELWLIDDASTDQTIDIAHLFHWPTIHVVQPGVHLGRSAARNLGLEYATGEFVLFLDADDELLPDALLSHIKHFQKVPEADLVYSDGYYCTSQGRSIRRLSDYRPGHPQGNVLNTILIHPLINACNCAMLRKQSLADHQIRFDPELAFAEDWDVFVRLSTVANFAYLPATTCIYRLHSGNSTLSSSSQRIQTLARLRERNLAYLGYSAITDTTRFAAFYQLLFEHLNHCQAKQLELISSTSFSLMAPMWRARLCRLIAADWILRDASAAQSQQLLERALDLNSQDAVARFLRRSHALSPVATKALLRLRRALMISASRPYAPFLDAGMVSAA